MRCPVCAHDETRIVATRESDESDVIRRCLKCEKRFITDERSKIALPAVAGPRLAGVLPCHHRQRRT
jgi:transcriptional repressor NrdR